MKNAVERTKALLSEKIKPAFDRRLQLVEKA